MNMFKVIMGPVIATILGGILILFGSEVGKVLIISLVIAILPIAWFRHSEWKERRKVERNLANFLRDLSESVRAGIPIYEGIEIAARGEYGGLTSYIRQMRWQIEAGASFEEALKRFANRVGTPRVNRAVSLILRASRAGGRIDSVLETASRRVRKHVEYSEKRRANVNAYVAIAYIAYFVFIGAIYALTVEFFPAIAEASRGGTAEMLPGAETGAYGHAFFYLGVIEAVATGVFAGKVGEGRIIAGLKHVVILITITFIIFALM